MVAERPSIEQLILDYAPFMADELCKIARSAGTEEDVRHGCNNLIDDFLSKAALKVRGRHEYGLAGGRIDSKYGAVIIEYKDPRGSGKISEDRNAPGTTSLVQQIQQRFADFQEHENIAPERIFGVGCDGRRIVFVRCRGGRFEVDMPQPITPRTMERLLRALVSLGARGLSYTPDHLAGLFGAESRPAREGIANLYSVITETRDRKALTFFNQWKILFGEVCGYDIEGKNEKIRELGDHYSVPQARPAELLFSVHTYYAVFIKFLAAEIITTISPLAVSPAKKCMNAPMPAKLRREVEDLERGGIWLQAGIANFLEGDLFSWYLAAWDDRIATVVWDIVRTLDQFDPTTLSIEPAENRDLLKKLYQHLFPKSVRHDLGEYYTPDWLAEHVLNELGYEGDPDRRLLDPACGSGTFLVMAINRVRTWFDKNRHRCGFDESELVQKILRNVIGFDLNPLAVMAARTNYLLAIRDLWRFARRVELPVYLCDSVMTPSWAGSHEAQTTFLAESGLEYDSSNPPMALKTAAGTFLVPSEIAVNSTHMGKYAETIEFCVRQKFTDDDFIVRCREEGLPLTEERLHRKLYEQLRRLDAENQNGIWARIIKNAFAPLFVAPMDYVAGNPPWINWESLPDDYRMGLIPLYEHHYGLFPIKGSQRRLGSAKIDLSSLFTYVALDKFLRRGGKLGFLLTQTLFKTKGAGEGFRQFRIGNSGKPVFLQPLIVHDFSNLQVFEGATNRTAAFICKKASESFTYPVPYVTWHGPSQIEQSASLQNVRRQTRRVRYAAVPVEPGKRTSPWLTAPKKALSGLQKLIGKSHYTAYEGVNTGGLNGCYWVRVLSVLPNGNLLIENMHNVGKIKVEQIRAAIEPDFVFPLLRGRDVQRWRALPSAYIIMVHDPERRIGVPEKEMKRKHPKTYAYLRNFEDALRRRASSSVRRLMESGAFYSMFGVGSYTMATWKVVWREQSANFQSAVCDLLGDRPILPDHKLMMVPCKSQTEAFYICGLCNSSPAGLFVRSYALSISTSTHVLQYVAIPQYDPTDPVHKNLAQLSRQCHKVAPLDEKELARLEGEIDLAAAKVWGIAGDELKAIQHALCEVGEGCPAGSELLETSDDDTD